MANHPDFSLEHQISRRVQECRESHCFEGHRPEQLWRWQVDHRHRLRHAMRLTLPTVYSPPRAESIESSHHGDLSLDFLTLQTQVDFSLPLYLIRPRFRGEGRTLIILHGLGRGAIDAVAPDSPSDITGYAAAWARAGFVVVVPELRGYGRLSLRDDRSADPTQAEKGCPSDSTNRLKIIYLRLGLTYAGCCVTDLIRLLDYIESRDEVDADRVGIAGIGQGARAMSWLAGVDDRLAAGLTALVTRSDQEAIFKPQLSPPSLIDAFGVIEPLSILAGYVPRPLYLQAARADKPQASDESQMAIDRLSTLYRLCDAEERFILDTRSVANISPEPAQLDFFSKWL